MARVMVSLSSCGDAPAANRPDLKLGGWCATCRRCGREAKAPGTHQADTKAAALEKLARGCPEGVGRHAYHPTPTPAGVTLCCLHLGRQVLTLHCEGRSVSSLAGEIARQAVEVLVLADSDRTEESAREFALTLTGWGYKARCLGGGSVAALRADLAERVPG